MKTKKVFCTLLCLSMLFAASCKKEPTSGSSMESDSSSSEASSVVSSESGLNFAPMTMDEIETVQNTFTAKDDDHVYYLSLYGLYKVPRSGGEAELITEVAYGTALAMHGDYLYYVEAEGVHQIHKSGKNKKLLLANYGADQIVCLGDTLYMPNPSLRYADLDIPESEWKLFYSIKDDVFDPTPLKDARFVYPNGIMYTMKDVTPENSNDTIQELYATDKDGNYRTKVISIENSPKWVVGENKLYFYGKNPIDFSSSLWSTDLNGGNIKTIANLNTAAYNFVNFQEKPQILYASGWIYLRGHEYSEEDKEYQSALLRINEETGELQKYLQFRGQYTSSGIDIVDGWVYYRLASNDESIRGQIRRFKADGSGEIEILPYQPS